MEIERAHLKILQEISDRLNTDGHCHFAPSYGQEIRDFQEEAQTLLALDHSGYISVRTKPTAEGAAAVVVTSLNDLGRRTLQNPIAKIRIDFKEQEMVLGQIYLLSMNEGRIPLSASFQPTIISENLQMGMEEVKKALMFLLHRGWLKQSLGEASYSLTEQGINAVLALVEGQSFRQVIMGDQYNNHGQSGAMGPNAQVQNNSFQQFQQQAATVNAVELVRALDLLLERVETERDDPDKEEDIASLELARKAADRGDTPKALKQLAKVGTWIKEPAIQVGAGLIVELVKKLVGF